MKQVYDVLIIGGGPAGYTAALYATRAGLNTVIVEKMSAGGQMTQTTIIDNYPGFDEGVDGYELGEKMRLGAERFGAKTIISEVLSVNLSGAQKEIVTDSTVLYAKSVIIATGAEHKHLGIDREAELTGRGVAYCGACDGMLYKGKTVGIVGGGNSAAADAMILSRICQKVILIHRRDSLTATKIYHDPILKAENIEFRWNSTVNKLLGENRISGVEIRDTHSGETKEIALDGLFISIGRKPETKIFEGQLELDKNGYIVADESTKTSINGVFAVGDVRTKVLRQVITAAADGAVAAHYAEEYLSQLN